MNRTYILVYFEVFQLLFVELQEVRATDAVSLELRHVWRETLSQPWGEEREEGEEGGREGER